ncbi:MAG TPA: hypothetical protein VGM23_06245 [Armatimonadota bacterium]|jgi:hypothetical protein
MGLLLAKTEDQALLAYVIAEAQKAAKKHHTYVGRTAVQKIMYFLQTAGIPMYYRFTMYHYGPFCEEISRDIDLLLIDGVIKDESTTQSKYSKYAPDEALGELLGPYREQLSQWHNKIAPLVDELITLSPDRMEEIATLDYIYRQYLAMGKGQPTKDEVVSKFVSIKGDKFPREEVETLYDLMTATGAIQPT